MHYVFVQWCWEKSIVSRGCEYSLIVTNVLEKRVARQMMTTQPFNGRSSRAIFVYCPTMRKRHLMVFNFSLDFGILPLSPRLVLDYLFFSPVQFFLCCYFYDYKTKVTFIYKY